MPTMRPSHDMIHFYGLKLLATKVALVGAKKFFKQTQTDKWRLVDSASNGPKIVKDVLWMRMIESQEGLRMPNGCRWFYYIPFSFDNEPHIYKFRVNPLVEYIAEAYPTKNVWSFHSY